MTNFFKGKTLKNHLIHLNLKKKKTTIIETEKTNKNIIKYIAKLFFKIYNIYRLKIKSENLQTANLLLM